MSVEVPCSKRDEVVTSRCFVTTNRSVVKLVIFVAMEDYDFCHQKNEAV